MKQTRTHQLQGIRRISKRIRATQTEGQTDGRANRLTERMLEDEITTCNYIQ